MKIYELLTENKNETPFIRDRDREVLDPKPELGSKNPEYSKPDAKFEKRITKLEDAIKLVINGKMSKQEYWDLVGQLKPVTPYENIPEPATLKAMVAALRGKGQYEKIDKDIPDGQLVHLRLDINSYENFNVWAPTIHGASPKGGILLPISHMPTAIVNNVTFTVVDPTRIGTGEKNKYAVATVTGNYEWATPADTVKEANAAMRDPKWIQVGMDPRRHSFFYNRATRIPVVSGSRAIQIAGLILLKDPKYGNISDYLYEADILKQIDEEILAELAGTGNGSTFVYGSPKVNQPHPCVDKNDPSCPGHKAGLKYQLTHTTEPIIDDPDHPSFTNGREQAANMIARRFKAISPTIRNNNKIIKPNMGGFKIPELPPTQQV